MKPETKQVSIRIPKLLWRTLKVAQINEQIESIQGAVIDGLVMLLKDIREKEND